jgi:8-oxo-dGTP diphosphatase
VPEEVLAAGGVLWRRSGDGIDDVEVALVHRPRYDDWSLPKGKLHRDEDALLGALREIEEETGMTGRAGRHLGTTAYDVVLGDRWVPKSVEWWSVRAESGQFAPSDEVDQLRWVRPAEAAALLTAGREALQVDALVRTGADVTTGVLVRHAVAGKRATWDGPDDLRPLTDKGRLQSDRLAEQLAAFGVTRVVSAPPVRCVQTVAPLAERLGLEVEREPLLGEDGYGDDPVAALARLEDLLRTDGLVVCSQGGALPALLDALADRSGLALGDTHTRKSAAWVLTLRAGDLVAADHRPPTA